MELLWFSTIVDGVSIAIEETAMESDKRNGQPAIPEDLARYLTEAQLAALQQVENFGVELAFVRRPLFQESTAVLKNEKGDIIGVLKKNGEVDRDYTIDIRH
jgi:hypothetical protein